MDLPNEGQQFEFDYAYRDEEPPDNTIIVVDVNDTHVTYKIPSVSIDKIFLMTHEVWIKNEDKRRLIAS